MIRLENVSKQFRRGDKMVHALREVSLEVSRGQLALLCGPSGSGKTTLINLCAGLATPTSGEIHIAENRVHAMRQAQRAAMRARQVAVVFQLFHLTPYLTALENIMLPTLSVHVADAPQRARQLAEQLGIADRINHRPGEMSAGERQRCALARALIAKPQLILADEPTGNLDDESATVVLAALDAARQEGAAILLVSHQPVESVKPDRLFRLQQGKLTANKDSA